MLTGYLVELLCYLVCLLADMPLLRLLLDHSLVILVDLLFDFIIDPIGLINDCLMVLDQALAGILDCLSAVNGIAVAEFEILATSKCLITLDRTN